MHAVPGEVRHGRGKSVAASDRERSTRTSGSEQLMSASSSFEAATRVFGAAPTRPSSATSAKSTINSHTIRDEPAQAFARSVAIPRVAAWRVPAASVHLARLRDVRHHVCGAGPHLRNDFT